MNRNIRIILILGACSFLFTTCNSNSNTSAQNSSSSGDKNSGGFNDGHKLKGRYVNTEQGIHSFTFKTDGSFARGGAVSGSVRGGEYSAGSHETGTYYLNGTDLKVTYENGDTETLPIEVFSYNDENGYSLESPTRIRIDNVTYINVSE